MNQGFNQGVWHRQDSQRPGKVKFVGRRGMMQLWILWSSIEDVQVGKEIQ